MQALFQIFSSSTTKKDFYQSLQDIIEYKKNYSDSIIKNLSNLSECLNDFQIRVNNLSLNLEDIDFFEEDINIHNLIKSIYKGIIEKIEDSDKTLKDINSLFMKYRKDLKDEIKIYDDYKNIFVKLEKEKEKLNKSKETYNKAGKEMEHKLLQFIDFNIPGLDKIYENEYLMDDLEQMMYPPQISLQDYKSKLKNINIVIELYNQTQNKFFNFLPEIIAKDDVFYFNLVNAYVNLLESENKKLNREINKLRDNKNYVKKENKSELKKLVEKYEMKKVDEKKRVLEHYPTKIEFNNCKNKKEFEVYFHSIGIIKKYIDNTIFPDYSYDTELKNYKMNDIIKKLFENKKEEISQNLTDSFLDLIEEPSVYHTLFVILSKLRTNGSFSQTKSLITLLGQGFEIVLSKSKKNKLYENVKNCIILSQTYYYQDDSNKKIYIFEFIKNNKWLKTAKFWRNFILYMIEKDLGRFDKTKEKDLTKLGDVVFSNLLTFASNMKNFEIDKRIIVKIMDEFIEKYNYINETNSKILFEMIIQEKEGETVNYNELDKLRKEYNISLETENIKDNDKGETEVKEVKEEKKEKEEKEEKEEKKEKEDIKEDNGENK